MTFIALVGFGKWGKKLAQNLPSLRAICDINESTLENLPPGIEYSTTNLDKILSDPFVKCVVIATPIKSHYKLAKKVLNSGRDCFVEKPLAMCEDEAEDLVEIAGRGERLLMVGHILQYHPAVRKMYQLIQEGSIGDITYIDTSRSNSNQELPLWNLAPHDISLVLGLVGNVTSISASSNKKHICIRFRYDDGEKGRITIGVGRKEDKFRVSGTDGDLIFDGHNILRKVDGIQEVIAYDDSKTPLEIECETLKNCIVNRVKPLTDGYEGLRVVRILEAAQKALDRQHNFHQTAIIDDGATIGIGTKIWHFCHLMPTAEVGRNCNIGQNCFMAGKIGNGCKVQNNVSIYEGVIAGNNVFFGPSCVLTNDKIPRANVSLHKYVETIIEDDVSIGANATIICGVRLGKGCMIGAGSVVTKDVAPGAIVVGNPARQIRRRKSL